jgi:hypothetical protein
MSSSKAGPTSPARPARQRKSSSTKGNHPSSLSSSTPHVHQAPTPASRSQSMCWEPASPSPPAKHTVGTGDAAGFLAALLGCLARCWGLGLPVSATAGSCGSGALGCCALVRFMARCSALGVGAASEAFGSAGRAPFVVEGCSWWHNSSGLRGDASGLVSRDSPLLCLSFGPGHPPGSRRPVRVALFTSITSSDVHGAPHLSC